MMGYFKTHEGSIKQREYVNIPAWHEKGYTGKGLTIFHDDIADKSHAEACVDIIQVILPDAKVLYGSIDHSASAGEVTSCHVSCAETKDQHTPFDEFIQKHNISQINNSTSGKANNNLDTPIAKYMRDKIKEHNLFCTGSAGNNDSGNNRYKGAFVMVSGVYFYKDTDKIMDYGPAWDWVDFSMFMGFQLGTSFAAPFLNGMAGLLRSKNPNMTQAEIYEYFKSHCKDLGGPGKDGEYGWGLPIMGDPETVIKLTVGSKIMTVDGKEVQIDQPPIINTDSWRTLVPVRAISEAFGADVEWDEEKQEITIVR